MWTCPLKLHHLQLECSSQLPLWNWCWTAWQTTALTTVLLQILFFWCKSDSLIAFSLKKMSERPWLYSSVEWKQISKLVAKWHFCPFFRTMCTDLGGEWANYKNILNSLGLYRSKNGSAFYTCLTDQVPPSHWSISEWRKRKNIFPSLQPNVEFT